MPDDSTRRQFLRASSGVAVLALAGCADTSDGDGGDNGTTTTTPAAGTPTPDSMTETPTADSTPSDGEMMSEATTFEVVVENVSSATTVGTDDGGVPGVLSPGAYASHTPDVSLFTPGEQASDGLEDIAEDGKPATLADSLSGLGDVMDSGAFTSPDGASEAGPLKPGNTYSFEVMASPENAPRLSFATMFVQSNDLFYAPDPGGIPLFTDGSPMDGEVTDTLSLWDAGTEVNEPPGTGPNQAPRQSGPDTGTQEGVIREVMDGYEYPDTRDVIELSLSVDSQSGETATFTATVANVSSATTVETPSGSVPGVLSPGAYAAHSSEVSLFTPGEQASDGLEDIAEDGKPATLAESLSGRSGVMDSGAFTSPDGASGAGPLKPGDRYQFQFTADSRQAPRLSLATMFVQSNDLFYAPDASGIPLFDGGSPIEGDLTDVLKLWDAGTEVNEQPGTGPNQAPRQSGLDTGTPEGVVRKVIDGYEYPETNEVISVTVSPT